MPSYSGPLPPNEHLWKVVATVFVGLAVVIILVKYDLREIGRAMSPASWHVETAKPEPKPAEKSETKSVAPQQETRTVAKIDVAPAREKTIVLDYGMTLSQLTPSARFHGQHEYRQEDGMLITAVEPGGPADRVGLVVGDILCDVGFYVARGGRPTFERLRHELERATLIAGLVDISYWRDGRQFGVRIRPRAVEQ